MTEPLAGTGDLSGSTPRSVGPADAQSVELRVADGRRLAALRQSHLLDTPPEPEFDRLTALAQRVLGVPTALLSLVDLDRQFFKSQQGLAEPFASQRETPLSHSFCKHVVASDAPLVVADARAHPLVHDNGAVTDLGVIAYLGAPIHSVDGHPLGALCAISGEPRAWTDDDMAVLLDLVAVVESEIALRAELGARTRAEATYQALFEASPDAVLVLDPETETVLDANAPARALYGRTRGDLVGSTMKGTSDDDAPGVAAAARLLAEGGTARFESVHRRADGTRFDVAISASAVHLDGRPVVVSVNRDVTERNLIARTTLARAAFREALADALRPLHDPTEIKAIATRLLGEHLHASRVHYGEIDDEAFVVVDRDYTDGAVSLVGRFRMEDFNPALSRAHDASTVVVTHDVANAADLSEPNRAAYAAVGVAAQICVPLVKGSRLAAVLAVHQLTPRTWTADEVALTEETAERIWSTVEWAHAEGALRKSEARFRQIAEVLPQLIWTARPDGTHDFNNGRWNDYTGSPLSRWEDAVHPDDRAESTVQWTRALATGEPYDREHRLRRASDGAYRWFIGRAEPLRNDAGEIAGWFGTSTDVHDLYEARERLQAKGEQLRLVHRATADVVWDWDVAAGLVAWNPAVADVLGWDEAVVGTDLDWWIGRLHPDDRDCVVDRCDAAIAGTEETWQIEYRFRRADGTYAFVLDRAFVVRDAEGVADRAVGSMVDLSERKAVELELVAAREAAETAARLKSSLLANMSHEIRTPLTAILGYADLLAGEAPPELQDLIEPIERGGQRLMDTLNSVLDLAQIEAGEMAVVAEPLDLLAEAEAACAALQPLALAKGLRLGVAGAPALALADRPALMRVLNNLVGNAIKFTDSGSVSVETGSDAAGAWLRVTDTGVGISREFLPALFSEFKQESEGHGRAYEGSGLGLAITERLAVLMGGEIAVVSEKGGGSTFTVRLPLAAESA